MVGTSCVDQVTQLPRDEEIKCILIPRASSDATLENTFSFGKHQTLWCFAQRKARNKVRAQFTWRPVRDRGVKQAERPEAKPQLVNPHSCQDLEAFLLSVKGDAGSHSPVRVTPSSSRVPPAWKHLGLWVVLEPGHPHGSNVGRCCDDCAVLEMRVMAKNPQISALQLCSVPVPQIVTVNKNFPSGMKCTAESRLWVTPLKWGHQKLNVRSLHKGTLQPEVTGATCLLGSLPESAFSWQPKHAAGSPHSAARGTSLGCSSAFPKDALPVSALLRRCSPASDLLGTINQGLWLPGASRACDVRGELATPWEGHRDQQVKRLREMEGASTVTMFGQDLPIPPPEAQLQV
ncbi:hypothetical protein AV530_006679 [Patagioenas fasciata monilis]|uniref:Uncharacterized protein n=1 Tax=Patagioenas fasciata monilis TaxID=372326 RepID=A0A1V4KQ33_PATFA|nr:hypothetical protein AV530_006679 [Patagioenas fasciata monilis]